MTMKLLAALAATAALAACAYDDYGYGHDDDRYGDHRYAGGDYDRLGNDCRAFRGSGGHRLDPWLACTREGEQLVARHFDRGRRGRISAATADRANIWFRVHADTNRDRRLTDGEIKAALVNDARWSRR